MPSEMTNEFSHPKVVSVTKVIPAPAQKIFDLLADPAGHALIDGSGTVSGPVSSDSSRLTLGSRFGMRMRLGVPYRITNEVVEFDEPRLIGWRHLGGHIWRYRLDPVPENPEATRVTEEFDWRGARSATMLRLMRAPAKNRRSMVATLDKMATYFSR